MSQFVKPAFFISPNDAQSATQLGLEKQRQQLAVKQELEQEKKKKEKEQLIQQTYYQMERIFNKIKEYSDRGTNMIPVDEIRPSVLERQVLIIEQFKFKWIDCDFNDSGIAHDSKEYLCW